MGQIKRVMEDLEAVRFEAEQIAVETGWMSRCSEHGELSIDDPSEEGHSYALANSKVKYGKTKTPAKDLKAALDNLKRNTPADCGECEYIASKFADD